MQNVYESKLFSHLSKRKEKKRKGLKSSFMILLAKKLSDNMNKVFMPNMSYIRSRTLVKNSTK